MNKGYWIAHLTITDQTAYDLYNSRNDAPIARHGGKFIVRGGRFEAMLGPARKRHVIVEFPSYADAVACFKSDEYQAVAKDLKRGAEVDFLIIEGHGGPLA